uniref:AAA domain-containing protein, putative AbiEii toxin, Type IV TA system n=1 Tax=Candidatus Kentrum sp. LFY TaxID=2126342 RepID=A0A450U7U2_9GAMM|nr:MAG: AAA domain-containing protein, putative AbiEii toxin, Type IV TA system [Candidatus Kentron sp. LFY]
MKIQIHDFGPIHHFECDLAKDLHLIVGENNVGKSYGITVVYLLLKALVESRDILGSAEFLHGRAMQLPEEIFDRVSALNVGDEADVGDIFREEIVRLLKDTFLKRFRDYIGETYGPIDHVTNKFSGESPRIRLAFGSEEIDIGVAEVGKVLEVKGLTIGSSIALRCVAENRPTDYEADNIVVYHDGRDYEHFKAAFIIACVHFFGNMLKDALGGIRDIHYLPALRSAAYQVLSASRGFRAALSGSRALPNADDKNKREDEWLLPDGELFKNPTVKIQDQLINTFESQIESLDISTPLNDYFRELSEIKPDKNSQGNDPIHRIAKDIERDILGGNVQFDGETQQMFYTPRGTDLRLDVDGASSMVSELSPLVVFLRYIVAGPRATTRTGLPDMRKGDSSPKTLVFMEEPEAHLHPVNQARLMSAFAALIFAADVKIFLTSHSNYLFTKLNNLILAEEIDVDVVEAHVFKWSKAGSKALPLAVDRLGIDDENFIDLAEALYEEKIDLIERMNADVR